MQAHNNTIEEFLGAPKTVFVVPVYQRNYDWQDDHCKQLFQDVFLLLKTNFCDRILSGFFCSKILTS